MNPPEDKSCFDKLVESMEYISYICRDIPDKSDAFPVEKNLSNLIAIKNVARKTLGYTNRIEKSGRSTE